MMKSSTFLSNLHHAYAQTDGSYAFPNSREGDMLKTAKREIEHHLSGVDALRKEIHQAEVEHTQACANQGIAVQVSKSSRLDALRFSFALVTGTAVNGSTFNVLLRLNADHRAKDPESYILDEAELLNCLARNRNRSLPPIHQYTDAQVESWMQQYNIGGTLSEGRCAMEDAQTLHLTESSLNAENS
jgi:hypothetical protein